MAAHGLVGIFQQEQGRNTRRQERRRYFAMSDDISQQTIQIAD
jgi:hypothetical protein